MAFGALICHTAYHFVQSASLANVHSNESFVGLAQDFWPLSHNHHWTLTETPARYPAGTPSHVDPVAIIPQDGSLHMFQQVLDGVDVMVGQPTDVGSGCS